MQLYQLLVVENMTDEFLRDFEPKHEIDPKYGNIIARDWMDWHLLPGSSRDRKRNPESNRVFEGD